MSNKSSKVQGEGDYKSAKKYNKKAKEFVKKNDEKQKPDPHENLSDSEIEEGNSAMDKAKSRGRN